MTVPPIDPADLARTRFADVEAVLITWAEQALALLGTVRAGTDDPDETLAGAWYVQIRAFGGPGERNPAQDTANIDVDTYVPGDADGNPDRGAAVDFAANVRSALLYHLPGYSTGGITVSSVATMSRPAEAVWDDTSPVVRVTAAYQMVFKSGA